MPDAEAGSNPCLRQCRQNLHICRHQHEPPSTFLQLPSGNGGTSFADGSVFTGSVMPAGRIRPTNTKGETTNPNSAFAKWYRRQTSMMIFHIENSSSGVGPVLFRLRNRLKNPPTVVSLVISSM